MKDVAKHWFWGGYILRQQWKCTQLPCLFSFCSSTMVDGVMILPVLIMMALPSLSWQGEWCAWWCSSCLLLEEPGSSAGSAVGAAWHCSTAPRSLHELTAWANSSQEWDVCFSISSCFKGCSLPFMYKIHSMWIGIGSCQGLGREMGNLVWMASYWAV